MRFLFPAGLLCFALACSSSSTPQPNDNPPAPTCTAGATQCSGLQVQTCSGTDWSAAADCSDGQVCRGNACADLTADEQARVSAISALFEQSRTQGAVSVPVDYASLEAKYRLELLSGDGSDASYLQTMWDALMSLPQGHQGLTPAAFTTAADFTNAESMGFAVGPLSVHKTCLTPYRDHAVVTVATTGSAFRVGDEVVAIDGKRGTDLQAYVSATPDAGDLIPPTAAGRFAIAIRAFLGRDRTGTVFTVKHAGVGDETNITLPQAVAFEDSFSCLDPWSRDAYQPAIGSVLGDGTGVLYIPGFPQMTVADFESQVGPVFDKVKDAPRLIIDLRGNYGGNLAAALDLVSQLPGAKKVDYCEFSNRQPNTDPPAFTSGSPRGVDPAGVPAGNRFAYTGRVAILTDGATFSSGEHFVLAARTAASVLVIGTKTAGAYGETNFDKPLQLPGSPTLQVTINESQVRTIDGKVLDGTSQEPDIVVEYEPSVVATHQDPMIARAMTELAK